MLAPVPPRYQRARGVALPAGRDGCFLSGARTAANSVANVHLNNSIDHEFTE